MRQLLFDFGDIMSRGKTDMGKTGVTKATIDTQGNAPIRQPAYRSAYAHRHIVDKEIDTMLLQGGIQPSKSPWASPVVLIPKKDGEIRFCIDYRKLNTLTKKDNYPLPRIDDTLDLLDGSKYFTSLDLASAYWQIQVDPADKEKTAFISHRGLFEFNVMPFGLCNAPAMFQRCMEVVLAGLQWSICLVYLDDIIILGNTWDEHLDNVRKVLQRLREAGLKLKPQKSFWARNELHYLGHVVSPDGIKPNPDKIKAVTNFPTPTTRKQLQSFLGLTNYYRKFVEGYAHIAGPLNALLHKSCTSVADSWDEDCQKAFEALKSRLTHSPILAYPDVSLTFQVKPDASGYGIGAILTQKHSDGNERVVAYASRTLNELEKKYSVTEREALATVWSVKFFRPYLYGHHFLLITDHASLRFLKAMKDGNARLQRWSLHLQDHDFDVLHKAGTLHADADALSRAPLAATTTTTTEVTTTTTASFPTTTTTTTGFPTTTTTTASFPTTTTTTVTIPTTTPATPSSTTTTPLGTISAPTTTTTPSAPTTSPLASIDISLDTIQAEQHRDPAATTMIQYLTSGILPDNPKVRNKVLAVCNQYVLDNDILYRQTKLPPSAEIVKQLFIPHAFRLPVLEAYHDHILAGHLGVTRTYDRLRRRFYWPTICTDTKAYVLACKECNSRKAPPAKKLPIQAIPVSAPFGRVATDVIGPLPTTTKGNRYIVVFTDYLTKWVEVFATKEQTADTIARLLLEGVVCRHGCPRSLLSDRGKNMTANIVTKLCQLMATKRLLTTAYKPSTDGLVERFNGTLEKMLSAYVNKQQKDWDEYVPYVAFAYNTSTHSATKETPFTLLYGREAVLPLDTLLLQPPPAPVSASDYKTLVIERIADLQKRGLLQIQKAQQAMEGRFPPMSTVPRYAVGQKVWVLHPHVPRGLSRKLNKPWKGPFIVLEKLSDLNYKVQPLGGKATRIVHINKLKIYRDELPLTLQEAPDTEVEELLPPDLPPPTASPPTPLASSPSSPIPEVQSQHTSPPSPAVPSPPTDTPIADSVVQKSTDTNTDTHMETPETREETQVEVEKIIDRRIRNDGSVQYKIKFKGYPRSQAEWVKIEDLQCPKLLERYETLHTHRKVKKEIKRNLGISP